MTKQTYMLTVDDICEELQCSKSHAYKIAKMCNEELAKQGYITMAGKVPKAFWAKKMYGYELASAQN